MGREEIISIIKKYFTDKPVKSVYLFGSFARGEAQYNDVDVLIDIDYSKHLSYFDLVKMQFTLEELTHQKVDIITKSAVAESRLYQYIKNDLALILENGRG
jgi:predicted nucleotidyltransferase